MRLAQSWKGLRDAIAGGHVASLLSEKLIDTKETVAKTIGSSDSDPNASPSYALRNVRSAAKGRETSHVTRATARPMGEPVRVMAKHVRLGDLLDGCRVIHKETTPSRGIVLLTLGCGESKARRPWLWSDEMIEVRRTA